MKGAEHDQLGGQTRRRHGSWIGKEAAPVSQGDATHLREGVRRLARALHSQEAQGEAARRLGRVVRDERGPQAEVRQQAAARRNEAVRQVLSYAARRRGVSPKLVTPLQHFKILSILGDFLQKASSDIFLSGIVPRLDRVLPHQLLFRSERLSME